MSFVAIVLGGERKVLTSSPSLSEMHSPVPLFSPSTKNGNVKVLHSISSSNKDRQTHLRHHEHPVVTPGKEKHLHLSSRVLHPSTSLSQNDRSLFVTPSGDKGNASFWIAPGNNDQNGLKSLNSFASSQMVPSHLQTGSNSRIISNDHKK